MKILLVEDDPATTSALIEALTLHHYSVDSVEDGETALNLAEAFSYDLVLLDIVIPKIDGLHVCQHLRSQGCQVPILLLTAKDSKSDRIAGLDAGADDYLVKPFDLGELLARMRALLRRGSATLPPTLTWEKLQFNPGTSEFIYDEKPLHLTCKEYGLLELFLLNPSRIFSRSAILDHLWTSAIFPGEEAVNTHMKTLRQKLKAAGASADFIETVYGMGYRLKPLTEPGALIPETSTPATSTEFQEDRTGQVEKLAGAMAQLKTQFQSYFLEQLAVLEQVAIALAQNNLNPELKQQGKQEAHKLAGSLGIFGFQEGSILARQLETLLMPENKLEQAQAKQFGEWFNQLHKELQPEADGESVESLPQKLLEETKQIVVSALPLTSPPTLLVIDDDRTLVDLIRLEGNNRGFRVEVAESIAAGKAVLSASEAGVALQNPPSLILLGLTFPDISKDELHFLKKLAREMLEIPVVVLSRCGGIDARVKAAEWGSAAFLQKPLLPQQIFGVIERILQGWKREQRVMVVDDDPATLAAITALLEPQMEVTALGDPQQFWEALTSFVPDLLILDIEMPAFNGIQLCQAVRTDPQWATLPILVLTAHQERDIRRQATVVGADEYISKPFDRADLLARIVSRLERKRLSHAL